MKNLKTIWLVVLMAVGYSNCSAMQLPLVEQVEQLDAQTPSNPDVQQLRHRQKDSIKETRKQQPIRGNISSSKFSMKKLLIAMMLGFFLFFTPAINLKPVQSEHLMHATVDTATAVHTNMIYQLQHYQQSCCTQQPCTKTYKTTACVLCHFLLPNILYSNPFLEEPEFFRDPSDDTLHTQRRCSEHAYKTFMTIFKRGSLHSNYVELWHAYKGAYGMIFDVMTEIAQRLYGDAQNQSPLFLRIFSEDFKSGGKNVTHFLKETWPLCKDQKRDEDDRARALLLSTNIALAGNQYDRYENTLYFFLSNGSIAELDLEKHLAHIFAKFMLSPSELMKEIKEIYKNTHLNEGHLLQIFVPREIANTCAYLSESYGTPYSHEGFQNLKGNIVDDLNLIAKLPISYDFFTEISKVQARLILNPRYAKRFIVYRYFTTPESEKLWQEARAKLHALFDKEFAQLGKETTEVLSVREKILMEEDGAREEGLKKLAALPKESPLCDELSKVLEELPKKDTTR